MFDSISRLGQKLDPCFTAKPDQLAADSVSVGVTGRLRRGGMHPVPTFRLWEVAVEGFADSETWDRSVHSGRPDLYDYLVTGAPSTAKQKANAKRLKK